MKIPKLIALFVVIGVMSPFLVAQAQQGLHASGGSATGNGSLSYSVGQVVYAAFTGSNGSIVQGVQQPYVVTLVGVVEEELRFHVKAYPNPTHDVLILDVSGEYEDQNLSYELFDSQGILLEYNAITSNKQVIPMERFIPGTYILRIHTQHNKQESKLTFQIIKN